MKIKIKNKLWEKEKYEITKYFKNEAYAYGFLAILNATLVWEISQNKIITIINLIIFLHCITKILSINQWRKTHGQTRKTKKKEQSKKNKNTPQKI